MNGVECTFCCCLDCAVRRREQFSGRQESGEGEQEEQKQKVTIQVQEGRRKQSGLGSLGPGAVHDGEAPGELLHHHHHPQLHVAEHRGPGPPGAVRTHGRQRLVPADGQGEVLGVLLAETHQVLLHVFSLRTACTAQRTNAIQLQ